MTGLDWEDLDPEVPSAHIAPLSGSYPNDCKAIEGHINNSIDYINELKAALENYRGKQEFDRRLAALKAAREHVNSLPSEQENNRGYRDHALKPEARITEELLIARYLLGENR